MYKLKPGQQVSYQATVCVGAQNAVGSLDSGEYISKLI